jgi:hypothetical protein
VRVVQTSREICFYLYAACFIDETQENIKLQLIDRRRR